MCNGFNSALREDLILRPIEGTALGTGERGDRGECEGWWQLKANINNPGLLYYPPALEVVYIRGVKITPD